LHFPIEIDGGIDTENVSEVVDAGVEWVVAGTSIFHTVNPRTAFEQMRSLAQNASAIKV
jgi:pentose-5-phosphate-3-epimerase